MAANRISAEDYVGKKYPDTRWTVLRVLEERTKRGAIIVACLCDCGAEKGVVLSRLRGGRTQSCGCLQKELLASRTTTHGHTVGQSDGKSVSREYQTWDSMLNRCRNQKNDAYPRYGGRGIAVCDRWRHSFENFLADMGPRPSKQHTLDRFPNNDGNYEPGNCRWATMKEQQRNRCNNRMLTHNGLTLCVSEWSERLGIKRHTINNRLIRGWSVDRIFTTI